MSFSRIRSRFRRVDSGGSGQGLVIDSPDDIPGLILWLQPAVGITRVQGVVTATGTTPPTVTLTGSPSNTTQSNIEIDITTSGTLGTALFQWKLNGVVQQTGQFTAASFLLGTTGITANFSAGTYAINNVYTSALAISTWADQSGKGHNVAQATAAAQPTYSASGGPTGTPAAVYAGGQSLQAIYADNQAVERYIVAVSTAASGSYIDGGVNNSGRIFVANATTVESYSGAILAAAGTNEGTWYAIGYLANGASSAMFVNGVQVSSGAGGSNNPGGITLGNFADEVSDPFTGSICEVLEYGGSGFTGVSPRGRAALKAYFHAKYGT